MTDGGSESLSLNEVAERFLESEQTLGRVREQLEALASVAERGERTQTALDESATAIRGFVESASQLTDELARSQAAARETIEAARELLHGEEATTFRASVDERLLQVEAKVGRIWLALPRRWHRRATR